MTALTSPTVPAPRQKQSAAERRAVYAYVTARDKYCRAPIIDPAACISWDCWEVEFGGACRPRTLERHHAGNTIGSKRITDARHVVLLCQYHHRTWAPSHSRLILAYLKDIEDAREKARRDFEEDGVPA